MPWSGSNFSRTDGTRTGSDTWQQASGANVKILSTDHDTHDQDLATGINACLKKDGGNTATANIPMGGFSLTTVGGMTLSSGAVLSWDSGDVTITHSSNALAFAGASSGYSFAGPLSATSALPTSSDSGALGSASLMWSDLFLASGAVINFNNGDVTITHSANALSFAGGSVGYVFDGTVAPTTNDGAPLGNITNQWSDLFLAEGGVINWDNGDVTLTQSGNSLTLAGGNLIFPGTATNDSAAAGIVGEYASSTIAVGSAVALSNGVAADVTSLSLTAGDWDVSGKIAHTGNGATTNSSSSGSVSTTSATHSSLDDESRVTQWTNNGAGNFTFFATGTKRISLAATTTVYLVVTSTFAVSTLAAYGTLRARRVR